MAWPCSSLNPEPRTLNPRFFRRGFTFTEVMFAVILLGIGFIMLAGMFPVAIQQTQTNVEESTASTLVQAATRYMEQTLTQEDVQPTIDPTTSPYPRFFRLTERCDNTNLHTYFANDMTLSDKLRGGFILPQDPRFAWTALYKRNPGDNFAQVIIFALQARNYSTYNLLDLDRYNLPAPGTAQLGTFEPRYLPAYLSDGGAPGIPDIIEFYAPDPNSTVIRDGALAEGCFVVVASDQVVNDDSGTPYFDPGYANGRIYRIGSRRADLDGKLNGNSQVWELMPGHDMQSPEENLPLRQSPHGPTGPQGYTDHKPNGGAQPAVVFVIGKGFTNPHPDPGNPTPDTTFSGFAQDIAVYTTFIRLK